MGTCTSGEKGMVEEESLSLSPLSTQSGLKITHERHVLLF